MERMREEHGIRMHRTTLPKDVEILRAAGVEVMSERKRALYYYLSDRTLSLPELRLLIDAVLSSKFITEKKSQELVEKLMMIVSDMLCPPLIWQDPSAMGSRPWGPFAFLVR